MKITIAGSLGHISRPLTQKLVQEGHTVTVISSRPPMQQEIEALGAIAAIGSLEDVGFITTAFTGADAVYTMVPPNYYSDHSLDLLAYYRKLGNNYAQAIMGSGVKRVVNLSSIGAHLDKGNGILVGAHNVEQILNALPQEVSITHTRPTSFYYNLNNFMAIIKNAGFIAANYGEEDIVPWVSTVDIATVVAEELLKPFVGRNIRYVASEEISCNEVAGILGAAIGRPNLKWLIIPDHEMLEGMVAGGMNPKIAAGLVEMYGALHSGLLVEDYYRNRPRLGKVKMKEFAKEFAATYNRF
jgi:uncharacterized protein YbjT (DUF2867 family)